MGALYAVYRPVSRRRRCYDRWRMGWWTRAVFGAALGLVVGGGCAKPNPQWIDSGRTISFGPTLIPGGQLKVAMRGHGDGVTLDVDLDSRAADLVVRIAIPGYRQ